MSYYFIVFSSRSQTLNFFKILIDYGFKTSIINSPESISSICNICVKFLPKDFEAIKKLIINRDFSSFVGVYKYDYSTRNGIIKKIF
ncbi:MAG TPA: DUF3343 domain-containing protein [Clostridiales bacterium]|nr:DUF3343 domain-containing protein [Clostridiales bacterium]